jgi:two-component system nitrogen regulation response regulator GlnG
MKPIWIVDDDQSIRFVLEKALTREQFQVRSFASARDVLAALETDEPQVLVSDIRMPGQLGHRPAGQGQGAAPGLPVIIMTAYSDLDSAVSAFQGGAFEYLPKPFDLPKAVELIRRAVTRACARRWATGAGRRARDAGPGAGDAGRVPRHRPAQPEQRHGADHRRERLRQGTGGARAAPPQPARRGPFVAINTAAIPKDLLESELFGHERGAFTGAQTMRRGRFEQADGGTLFLDEIGDMPFDLQTRLLRVLSDGQFYRVGGHQPLKANVRVIAATHQNLEESVRQGAFREDLFHRLNVIRLRLPALRERREDIPMLTRFFLGKSARELGVDAKRITDAALQGCRPSTSPATCGSSRTSATG